MTFDSWEFWWGYNRDGIQNLRSGLEATAGDDDVIVKTVLPALVETLADPKAHWYMRKQAVLALGRVGASRPAVSARIAKQLIDIMINKDGKEHFAVEEEAALALGVLQNRDEVILDTLCARVLDSKTRNNPRTRAFAALALGLLRVEAADAGHARVVRAFRDVLQSKSGRDMNVQGCILIAMGLSGDAGFLPDLLEIARGGSAAGGRVVTDVERAHAISALGRLTVEVGGPHLPEVIKVLGNWSVSGNAHCARSAAITLGQIARRGDLTTEMLGLIARRLTYLVKKAETQTACFAIISLGRLGGAVENRKILPQIFDVLRTQMRKGSTIARPYAALALGLMGASQKRDGDRQIIREAVRTELERYRGAPRNRGAYAIAAGILGDRQAAGTITKIMMDTKADHRLRGHCAVALGLLRESKALEDALDHDGNGAFGTDLAVGLALCGSRRSEEALLKGLADPKSSLYVQVALSLALGRLGDGETVDRLIRLAKDTRLQGLNRAFAVATLGRMAALGQGSPLWRITTDLNYRASFNALDEVAAPK